MNPILAAGVIAILLGIRLAVPCALVGGLCYAIDRLTARWEKEAELSKTVTAAD